MSKNRTIIVSLSVIIIIMLLVLIGQSNSYKKSKREYVQSIKSLEDKNEGINALLNQEESKNKELEKEIDELKNSPSILFSVASEKQNEKHFDEAIKKYNEVADLYPASKEAKLVPKRLKEIEEKKAKIEKKKEEEAKAKEEARKPPLELVDTYLKLNSISNPEAYPIVKNTSNKTLV